MREKQTGTLCKKICLSVFFPVILVHSAVWAETTYSDPRAVLGSGQQPAPVEGSGEAPITVETSTENARLSGRSEMAQVQSLADSRVREVRIQGNHIVPSSAILKKVQTKTNGPLIIETVEADIAEVLAMGWFSDVKVDLTETEQGVYVDYLVEENPRFQRLELVGCSKLNREAVVSLLRLEPGEIVNTEIVNRQLARIISDYKEAGYPVARVRDMVLTEKGVLRIVIDEGVIEKITVSGNEKVRPNVILRELRFRPGDVFNTRLAQRSLQRLNNLGYFYATGMKLKPGVDPTKVEVVVEVEEQGTATVGLGVGYSEYSGVVGTITLADRDFLGLGDDARLQWEMGEKSKTDYLLSYTKPWLDKKETMASFTFYKNIQEYSEYNRGGDEVGRFDQKSRGEEIAFSRAAGEYTRNYVTLKHRKDSYVKPIDGYEPQYYEESYNRQYYEDFGEYTTAEERRRQNFGETRSISFSHVYDSRDYIFNPHGGKYRSFTVEYAGFGGDFRFTKYSTDFRYYFPHGKNTIAIDLAAGYAEGNMPLSQRFSMGGASLRGYKENQFLGNSMLKGTVEYRIPISNKITGLFFMDYGYAWDKRDERKFDLGKMKFGYGLGVRFWTPIGPVRLDYGIGNEHKRFHFSFGYPF